MMNALIARNLLGLLFLVSVLLVPTTTAVQAQNGGTQGTIIVAVAANAAPFAAQAENGQLVGFDLDIMQTLARTAGLRITYEAVPFAELIPGVTTRLYDAAIGCIFINDTRRALVNFTTSYFSTGAVLVFAEPAPPLYDFSDLTAEMTVAVSSGSVSEALIQENSPAKVLSLNSDIVMVNTLLAGNADAALTDEITAAWMIRTYPEAQLRTLSGLLTTNHCGIAVNKGNSRLLLELNAALTRMKNNGRYLTIYRRWFGTRPLNGPRPAARPTSQIAVEGGDTTTLTPAATEPLDPLVESALGLYMLTLATEPTTYQLLELAPGNVWLESMVVPQTDTLRGIQELTTGTVQTQTGSWQSTRVDPIEMSVRISATVPLSATVLNGGTEAGGAEAGGAEAGGIEDGVAATPVVQPRKSYQLTIVDDGSLYGSYTLYTTAVPTTSQVLTETLEFVGKRVLQ